MLIFDMRAIGNKLLAIRKKTEISSIYSIWKGNYVNLWFLKTKYIFFENIPF